MSKNYIIGTRGSLLAVTQCTLIKNEITSLTGKEFELQLIKTQGDQLTEKPLWQMDGKDFFTKELDEALLSNQVDLVVHSYKDLGSERPDGITLATVTERKFANDILLIKKETISQLKDLNEFIVGTSSPRRIVNIESSLTDLLPCPTAQLKVKCETLRGNVNTRIQKLKDGHFHAIVLAMAGLDRLSNKEESQQELAKLLEGITFMILPQKVFPSSAAQGALAIEYNGNTNNQELYQTLQSVHSEVTESEVTRERSAFQSYGGGCHLAVGIHVRKYKDFFIHLHKGVHDGEEVNKSFLEGIDYSQLKNKKSYIVLGDKDVLIKKEILNVKVQNHKNVFVTSRYCLNALEGGRSNSIWSSGLQTAKQLAKKGFWINGCAEGLGHNEIKRLASSNAIQMMLQHQDWNVLSHNEAKSELGDVLGCYSHQMQDVEFDFHDIEVFFWSSFYQYQVYTNKYPEIEGKMHACGLGKTYDQFCSQNIKVYPFIDMDSFRSVTAEVNT